MVLFNLDDGRTWKGLLVLGLLLNIVVCFSSDLGLDTHVKMAVDADGGLPWGDLRPDVAGVSDPSDAGERTVLPMYSGSEASIKAFALVAFFALIGYVHRAVGERTASILALSPAFIFSVGRGYEEVYFALAFAVAFGLFTEVWSSNMRLLQNLIGGCTLMLIPYAKGMSEPSSVLFIGVLLGLIGYAWHALQGRESSRFAWMRNPLKASAATASVIGTVMLLAGIFDATPTFGVMKDAPLRFLSAVVFSLVDAIGLFVLFGMVVWPLLKPAVAALRTTDDAQIATMSAMITAAMTAIVFYIAALWTYESVLWGASWPGVVWTMGNNGRYVTLLFIPLVVLLKQLNLETGAPTFEVPGPCMRAIGVTLLLLVPLSFLAGLHGQTMWTDEAADKMNLENGDHFLFVSDATLGMHWLYTFYEPLDADANNLTGHWRSTGTNWIGDVEADLSHVTTIVLAPEVDNVPTGWSVESSGEADLLNGGGEWRVLTRT
jgi:uncharacterized membrane protein HdeD (DUF308 family)